MMRKAPQRSKAFQGGARVRSVCGAQSTYVLLFLRSLALGHGFRRIFPEPMSFPGVGAERRECLVCGKVFLIYRSEAQARHGGYFCSRRCCDRALGLFWEGLASGRINVGREQLPEREPLQR
jgi:hypothetical protein